MKAITTYLLLLVTVACGPSSQGQQGGALKAIALAAGAEHSLALMQDGTVWAWGRNSEGQLGDGSTTDRSTPQRVEGLEGVQAIATGSDHSLALDQHGQAWIWGRISHDQLGVVSDETTGGLLLHPEPVQGLNASVTLAAGGILGPTGYGHSLALDADGAIWAWGYNIRGQLGNGSTASTTEPVAVALLQVTDVAASGFTSLARLNDGTLWSWGSNARGQLGDGTTTSRHVPGQVEELHEVIAAAAGGMGDMVHVLALRPDGTVWAWGDNTHAQLGTLYTEQRTTPTQVPNVTAAQAVAAGNSFSLALDTEGQVWAWGSNTRGQLGDGSTQDRSTPEVVISLEDITAVIAGGEHALALDTEGQVWAWGSNTRGQLGDGSTQDRSTPEIVRF